MATHANIAEPGTERTTSPWRKEVVSKKDEQLYNTTTSQATRGVDGTASSSSFSVEPPEQIVETVTENVTTQHYAGTNPTTDQGGEPFIALTEQVQEYSSEPNPGQKLDSDVWETTTLSENLHLRLNTTTWDHQNGNTSTNATDSTLEHLTQKSQNVTDFSVNNKSVVSESLDFISSRENITRDYHTTSKYSPTAHPLEGVTGEYQTGSVSGSDAGVLPDPSPGSMGNKHPLWELDNTSNSNLRLQQATTGYNFDIQQQNTKEASSGYNIYYKILDGPLSEGSESQEVSLEQICSGNISSSGSTGTILSILTLDGAENGYVYNISDHVINCTNYTSGLTNQSDYDYKNPLLGVLLAMFAMVTICGNILVMIAVARERYLRTVTNYFIVSLAIADLIIGALVMPFAILLEMTNQYWLFGHDWCDVWHSVDVLASTASILNLSMISLDRYWAITDPIAYPSKMSTGRAVSLIALVWICSAAISFPAILWWRSVAPSSPAEHVCLFTDDATYLVFSSLISFYVPIGIILFAYYKIYVAATEQIHSLKVGAKVMHTSNGEGGEMTLRIHRGGYMAQHQQQHRRFQNELVTYTRAANSDSDGESPVHIVRNNHGSNMSPSVAINQSGGNAIQACAGTSQDDVINHHGDVKPSRMISKKWKHFALSRKLSKLAKEQKAAKTLGIVMGVFCLCWVPFFVTNVLYGICNIQCVYRPEILFPIFTWLGYLNSGMNPIIYAMSMRDFRRAFTKILFCCCPKYGIMGRRKKRNKFNYSFSTTYTMT